MEVTTLGQLVAGLSLQYPAFHPRAVNVGFVVDKVTLRRVLFRVVRFFAISIVLLVLVYISLIYHRRYIISATYRVDKENTVKRTQTTFFHLKY